MEYAAEALSDEASEITPNDLAGDYACIAEIIGIENTILLHKHYRGQQITLPQRLYSVQYVVKEVERQLGTHSLSDLAKKYGYTERRLRQLRTCPVFIDQCGSMRQHASIFQNLKKSFIVFLILLIIYLFTHKKTKGTKKPFRFVVWGVGILTIALFAAACILPADNQNESLSKQESTEYYRISTAINNGKFDHILSDIDKLFPPDKDLNSIRQTNRFMLLRLYYEKTGDTKKEKQLLTETSKNSEIMNDDVTKGIVEERLKELK